MPRASPIYTALLADLALEALGAVLKPDGFANRPATDTETKSPGPLSGVQWAGPVDHVDLIGCPGLRSNRELP